MRIAVLIIGLALSLIILVQSCAAAAVGGLEENEENSTAGAVGFLVAILYIVAAALILPKPKVAMIIFLFAAPIAFLGAAGSDFSDLYVWGVVSLILAAMSWFGLRSKHRDDEHEAASVDTRPTKTCPECAEDVLLDAKVCKHCRHRFESAPETA